MTREKEVKTIKFSWADAFRFGYDNIKRRFHRTRIVLAAITLGIAFFSTLYFTDAFFNVQAQIEGGSLRVENYQYWLVLVSLIVSVVSITNSMLIAVYERYREIGTMKCLGALDQHILKLFLVESVILALVGGTLGFGVGLVASVISCSFVMSFKIFLQAPTSIFLTLLGEAIFLSVTLSAAATLYPACKAAKLNPVEALRHEI